MFQKQSTTTNHYFLFIIIFLIIYYEFCSLYTFVYISAQQLKSVNFIEEINEFLEVYFVIRFHTRYFDHRINLLVCYTLAQYLEYVFQVFSAYISFPVVIQIKIKSISFQSERFNKDRIQMCLLLLTFSDQTLKRRELGSFRPYATLDMNLV